MSIIHSLMLSAVEISPVVVAVACMGAMVMLFIKAAVMLRMQNDETMRQSSQQNSNVRVPRLKMTRVHIPFTFRLEGGSNTCDEVKFAVTSQIKYTLQAFWVVSIRELHVSLWRPWKELQEALKEANGTILEASHCQKLATDLRAQSPHNEIVIKLKSPKPPLVLGAPPRLAYPLVVFLIRDDETDNLTHPDETVVLVNIVHLRDPVCPLPTSILAQYLKQASGQLSCLKQLYLATGDSITSDDSASQQSGSLSLAEPVSCAGSTGPLLCSNTVVRDEQQQDQLCVVCQYFPLSRALLPCRHTCICAVCFSKLDRCPMCRAPITSYFCIRSEDYVPPNMLEQQLSKDKSSNNTVHWLDALNDRLTDFLGFR
uniref:CSON004643 protein n=2 Tax=Culicoides sonorensis TaxID=179676 RepID=A0A336N1J5_CULSO